MHKIKDIKKLKFRWISQRIEIFIKRFRHNFKTLIFKIIFLIILAIGLVTFNYNLDKIKIFKEISLVFSLKFLDNLFGIHINLIYIIIYLLSIAIFIAITKKVLKLNMYKEYDEYLDTIFTPKTQDEIKTLIAPEVIVEYQNPLNKKVKIIETFSNSIKEPKWREEQENIEHYFKYYVKAFEPKGTDKMLLYLSKVKPFVDEEPSFFKKEDLITNSDDIEIILGKNGFDRFEVWNASRNVHSKFMGASRTGKTYMQKLINVEILLLGHKLYLYDGKGIDYNGQWKKTENCIVVNTELGLLNTLILINEEHERRVKLLNNNNLDTIDKYNKTKELSQRKQHIFLVIEEAADIFGKSFNETKENKKEIEMEKSINNATITLIEKLVRKGGATGIHICLNSQKLTATMLPKQLPVNITENWSAHVDAITSQIAIGNNEAYDLIPRGAKGVFINDEHIMIKSLLVNEDILLEPLTLSCEVDGDIRVAELVKDLEKYKNSLKEN